MLQLWHHTWVVIHCLAESLYGFWMKDVIIIVISIIRMYMLVHMNNTSFVTYIDII